MISKSETVTHFLIYYSRGKPTVALVGDLTLERQTSNFRKVVPVSNWFMHPEYRPPLRYNDIALVQLSTKLELSRYLLPACLPVMAEKKNAVVEAIGWGTLGIGGTLLLLIFVLFRPPWLA
jgi:hypothetical protein